MSLQGIHVVWKGYGTDERIWHAWSDDGENWQGNKQIIGLTSHDPALAIFQGRLHMVWKGHGSDDHIWHVWSDDGENWSQEQPIYWPH